MKFFFRLNFVSILYALFIFIPVELYINIPRITRLMNLESGIVPYIFGFTIIVEIIAGTVLLYQLTKKWLNGRISKFWTVILWLPYFIFFVFGFASFFPSTYAGDNPGPGAGLLLIGGLIFYPLYILILNIISTNSD